MLLRELFAVEFFFASFANFLRWNLFKSNQFSLIYSTLGWMHFPENQSNASLFIEMWCENNYLKFLRNFGFYKPIGDDEEGEEEEEINYNYWILILEFLKIQKKRCWALC